MNKLVVGIDVGGTNVKLGLISQSGRIIDRTNFLTRSYVRNKKRLIDAICEEAKNLISKNHLVPRNISGIGIGLPGLVDPLKGIVQFLPNIPGWRGVPLKQIMQRRMRIPTFLENDVNLITLGEWRFGAGVGVEDMVCITLGTGVGGGLILNNQLYRGPGFSAGEVGHIPINENGPRCNCGGFACLERCVGNRYLSRKIKTIFKKALSLEDVHALAVKGDCRAVCFWKETAVHIGNGLVGVVNLLNPRRIIIGGGIANSHRFLFKTIEQTIKARAMKVQGAMVKIVKTKLGNDGGIVGARVLVHQELCRKATH